jgi:hypothetical protein
MNENLETDKSKLLAGSPRNSNKANELAPVKAMQFLSFK